MKIKNYLASHKLGIFIAIFTWVMLTTLYAGETGRIIGRVTDAQTGEPLSGVNVVVEGTELGAATDNDGRYLITNVPSRRVNVTASYIGFEPVTVKDVLVIIDQTVTVDFKLKPTTIMIEKPVIIEAEREMVIRTAVATTRTASSEEFNRLPVNALTQIVSLQAGVTQNERAGWTHIRGGRFDDVSYLIDGVAARDATLGTMWASPKPTTDAISEVIVITGSFDPEYGEAMSGIVQAVTKEGGTKTSTKIKYTTDEMFPNPDLNFGYNQLSWTLGGPIPFYNRMRYFLSTQYFKTDDNADAKYKIPAPRGEYTGEAKLTYNVPKTFALTREGLKLTADGHLSEYQWHGYSHTWRYWLRGWIATRVRNNKFNFHLNQMLSPQLVWTLKTGYFSNQVLRAPRDFELEAADTTGFWGFLRKSGIWDRYLFMGEDWVFHNPRGLKGKAAVLDMYQGYKPTGNPADTVIYHAKTADGRDTILYIPGVKGLGYETYDYTNNNPYGVPGIFIGAGHYYFVYWATFNKYLKGDISWTPNKIHEFKTGFEISRYNLVQYYNQMPYDANPFWEYYNVYPTTFAAYIQDRADFEDLVVRGGVRFDYLDPRINRRLYPDSIGGTYKVADLMVPTKKKFRLSPRLGISFPITERIKFRFSYGHFFKTPTFDYLYSNSEFTAMDIQRRPNIFAGNPNLDAEKTIAYEMGFDAQLSDIFAFDMTTYYKDVFDLTGTRAVQTIPTYTMYTNVEYGRIMGAEFTFSKQLSNYWRASASYTYQIAKGTAATPTAQYYRDYPIQIDVPLDHDIRHQANFDFTLAFPTDFILIPLRDFDASLLARYHSGLPYTPTDVKDNSTPIADENSARMPGSFSIDSRINKAIKIRNFNITLFCDITNVLNAEIVTNVFACTGSPNDRGRRITINDLSYPGLAVMRIGEYYYHPARDFNHDGVITRYEYYKSYMDAYNDRYNIPTYYGPPRKIRFGISLEI
ncbi:MAG: TonB-dependent receptor [candidate division WOR-3 bacterium]